MGQAFRWKARHTVLAIIFFSWIVSFMDRIAMSVAIPYIAVDFDLSPLAMGVVMSAFFASYSISHIPGGLFADMFGVRKVATIGMVWWSAFTAITGVVANLTQMLTARFVFGLGEGVYPACSFKTVAVWFPKSERAMASSIMLAATSLGAAISPLLVGWIMSSWGWRAAFYSLSLPGALVALLFWIFIPNKPADSKRVSSDELKEIEEDYAGQSSEEKIEYREIIRQPYILKYFFALFSFDIAYWGFTTWLPTYLVKARGFSMTEMGIVASLPFFAGVVGSLLGGWLSDKCFSENRKIPIISTQLLAALCLYLTFASKSEAMLIVWQTLAGFGLKFFFSTFWALPMNTVPRKLMGITSGFINMAAQIAAFISPLCVGYLVGISGGKFSLTFEFMIASIFVSCAIIFTLPNKMQSD